MFFLTLTQTTQRKTKNAKANNNKCKVRLTSAKTSVVVPLGNIAAPILVSGFEHIANWPEGAIQQEVNACCCVPRRRNQTKQFLLCIVEHKHWRRVWQPSSGNQLSRLYQDQHLKIGNQDKPCQGATACCSLDARDKSSWAWGLLRLAMQQVLLAPMIEIPRHEC